MNLSARNQLKATVAAVKKGAVNDEVSLRLADGTTLTSIITETSCESLGLKEGVEAYAVIKATNVMIGDLDAAASDFRHATSSRASSTPSRTEW